MSDAAESFTEEVGQPIRSDAAFVRWQAALEQTLEQFIANFSPQVAGKLDFSPPSLATLEAWLLSHYPLASALREDVFLTEKLAMYVGEVFRRQLGGAWTVLLDEPGASPDANADLRGIPLMNCPPACCPRQLVFEALRKRSGYTLRAAFEYFKKRRQREAREAAEARDAAAGQSAPVAAGVPEPGSAPARSLAAAPAPAAVPLQVYGFRRLPRESIQQMLGEMLGLTFEETDSISVGPYATAQRGQTVFRLFHNYNVLENEWLEDRARACSVLLYVDGLVDATQAAEFRREVVGRFPTVQPLSPANQ